LAQFAHLRVDVGIVGDQGAAIAKGAEVFLDDEAGSAASLNSPTLKPGPLAPMAWGVILNDFKVCAIGNLLMATMVAHWPYR